MTALRVLFVGDSSHDEFREPVAWLREYCDLTIAGNIEAATAHVAQSSVPPDVIVVGAARPGQFSQQDIASLLRRAPLVRLVGLMGGWCEGELRTGQPWRGVTRVYWHAFVPRMAEELAGASVRGRSAMPRTFTESELSGIPVFSPDARPRGMVVVRAATIETYEAIAEACEAIGHSTVWSGPRQPVFTTGAVGAIWDVAASIKCEEAELSRFVKRMQPIPVIAMIGFPRASDRQRAFDCGATSVLSKPYLLQELWTELTRVTSRSSVAVEQVAVA